MVCFVLGEEQRNFAPAEKDQFAQQRMPSRNRTSARRSQDLLEVWFLRSSIRLGNPRRPVVPEPQRRQKVQFCRLRSTVGCGDADQDVLRTVLGIFHEDVEVSIFVEDTGVEEFILHVILRSTSVRVYQVGVGIRYLGVLVEILHVRVSWRAVEVEVVLLHILSVVAFAVGQPE